MIEEVIEIEKQAVYQFVRDKEIEKKKYKTSDGSLFDSKTLAQDHQDYIDASSSTVSITLDSLFSPDGGKFYFFKKWEEMNLIISREYTKERWGDENYCKNAGYTYPGWYYLRYDSNGDYRDTTTIFNPKEVKDSMKETLDAFSYMSVVESA